MVKGILALALVCASATPGGAAQRRTPDSRKTLAEARALLLEGRRKEAVSLLRANESTNGRRSSTIIAEQFVTTENFQVYQEMKAFTQERLWSDCLKQVERLTPHDRGNLIILRLKSECQLGNGQNAEAQKTYYEMLELEPGDPWALMGLARMAMVKKHYDEALRLLEPLAKVQLSRSEDRERLVLIRADILFETGRYNEAVQLLVADQEKNLDHMAVIYKLGELYQRRPGLEWQSRRSFALFASRYRKLANNDPRKRALEGYFADAEARIATLDKKLEVAPKGPVPTRPPSP